MMEYSPETLEAFTQSAAYVAMGIAAWPVSKYVLLPIIDNFFLAAGVSDPVSRLVSESHKRAIKSREKVYSKLIEKDHNPEEALVITERLFPVLEAQDRLSKIFDSIKPLEDQV